MNRQRKIALGLLAAVGVAAAILLPTSGPKRPFTFYVDCAGDDANNGLSQDRALATVSMANELALRPGDTLLFKRGCVWTGTGLQLPWNGTLAAPITIGGYGTASALPKFVDKGITVTGSYEIIDGLAVGFAPVRKDPCGQPLGYYNALAITQGGSHNVVKNSELTQATIGVHITKTAGDFNAITHNQLVGNNVVQVPFDGVGDLGAWGVLVRSNHNDISYNTFRDNRAVCAKGNYLASNSVEIYEGDFNSIHHNQSYGDRVFSELGGSRANKAEDNSFAFNLDVSTIQGARFITTRGALDTAFGPVNRTTVDRNTVLFTGEGSQGISCGRGCSPSILTARWNVIDVVEKTIYFDNTMGAVRNLLWSPSGGGIRIQDGGRNRGLTPGFVNDAMIVKDPQFGADYTAKAGVDQGGITAYSTDLRGHPAVIGAQADIGAFEAGAVPPTTPSDAPG